MLAGMELSGGERLVAWVSLVLAVGVLAVSVDLLTGGRLFGWSTAPGAGEVADDDC